MRLPMVVRETLALARQDSLWGLAFVAVLLIPLMLIFARVGIEICCGIIGLSFLWRSLRNRQWHWLHAPFTRVCLVTYLWLVLVVTPLAVNPSSGVSEALLWFRLPLMFVAMRYWVLVTPAARAMVAAWLAGLLALVVLDVVWQWVTGMSLTNHPAITSGRFTGRLTGPFENPKVGIFISKLMVPTVAMAAMAALTAKHPKALAAIAVLFAASFMTIIISGERSAFLTVGLACAVTLGLLMVTEKRMRFYCFIAGAGVVALAVLLYMASPWVQLRGDQIVEVVQHFSQSDYGQLFLAGYDMGREHWLHGVGLRGFNALCPELPYSGGTFRGMHPHNVFIEWFAETGLAGLLLFLIMLAALAREAVAHLVTSQGLLRLMPIVAIAVLAQNFFPLMGMQSFFTNWSAMLLWYVLALSFASLPRDMRR